MPDRRTLLALTLAGLLVRAAFLLLEPETHPIADERTWTNWAIENLVSPKVRFSPLRTHMIFHPPLYPYFIAVLYELFGSLGTVKWAQVLVSALLIPAVGLLAARVFGARTALVSAAIVAFYPDLVWFSVHFWCETLFLTLLVWAFERLFAADTGRRSTAAAAGLLWGLSILTRETALYFTPLLAAWLFFRRGREGLARGALFLLVSILTVAPWTLRNWVVFRAFVPVSTAGGLNLYQGNAPLTRQQVYDEYDAVSGRIEQYRWARRRGIEVILDRQPWWILEKLRDEMPRFWEADSLALIHIERGAYGEEVRPGPARAAALVVILPYLALVALFVLGLARLEWGRTTLPLIGFLVCYNLLHVATHGFARYRLPVMPVVIMVAASELAAWRVGGIGLDPRRKRFAAALAAAFAVVLAPSLFAKLREPVYRLLPPIAHEQAQETLPVP